MLNELALRTGRPDLARSRVRAAAAPNRGETIASFAATTAVGPARARGGVSFDTGTVSVGMLAGLIIGVGAFYFWTRGHQG